MAQANYTPISLYYSTTASAVPLNTNLVDGELAINITDGKLYYKDNAGVVKLLASNTSSSATVSSVAQTFTGGLISVTGSPITTSGTLALTVAGNSGGIPYFSSASTWATSAALAANSLVVGGGAGAAPASITTGTGVVTALGVNTGTAGAFVVNGGALGTPSSGTVTNLTGTASININGTVGATTPASGSFTSITDSGNLTFTGTGNRITGDFSNATLANRVAFQTSTTNGNTGVFAIPNGTGTAASFRAFTTADPTNSSNLDMAAVSSLDIRISSAISGTGTYLPMTFYTGGSERIRILTDGKVGIGTSSPIVNLDVNSEIAARPSTTADSAGFSALASDYLTSSTGTQVIQYGSTATGTTSGLSNASLGMLTFTNVSAGLIDSSLSIVFATTGAERMRLTNTGLGIGTTAPSAQLDVVATINGSAGQISARNLSSGSGASSIINVGNDTAGNALDIGVLSSTNTFFGGANSARIQANNGNMFFGTSGAYATQFVTSGLERMRIDSSGNVGIGTTSATTIGTANGWPGLVVGSGTGAWGTTIYSGSASNGGLAFANGTTTTATYNGYISYNHNTNAMTFATNAGTERMRINSSGNIIVGSGEASATPVGNVIRAPNATGTNIAGANLVMYAGDGTGTGGSGYIDFQVAPVGSSGSTANTLASAMRITNAGNVGIGTSSPAVKLDVNGITGWGGGTTGIAGSIVGASSGINNGGNLRVLSNTTQAADVGGALTLGGYYTSTTLSVDFGAILGAKENSTAGNTAGYLAFGTRPNAGNMTERMRITSSGGVSFGATGTAYGTSGQVLTSAGNAPPTWSTPSGSTKAIKSLSLYAFNGTVSATSGAFTASVTGLLTGSTFTTASTAGTATSSGTTMTVSAVTAGALTTGQTITFTTPFAGTATSSGTTMTIATATAGAIEVGTVLNTNASFTASRATTVMTVTAVASGGIHVGMVVSSLGTVNSFGTGTGGVGTYNMSASGTVASGARTGTGTATITALGTGTGGTGTYTTNRTFTYGTASAVTYNSGTLPTRTISALGTGTGSTGTYTLSSTLTAANATAITTSAVSFTVTSGTETGTTGTLTPAYTIVSQTVTSNSGTWTAPTGVTSVRVTLIGGGGGGGFDTAGCGVYTAGGYGGGACGVYTVSGGTAYSYSVGLGGNGSGNVVGSGVSGGTTSFSSFISATGGGAGTTTASGTNGIGSNGTIRNVQTVIQTVYYGYYGCSLTSTAVVFNALSGTGALYSAGFGGTSTAVNPPTTSGLAGVSGAILLEWNE